MTRHLHIARDLKLPPEAVTKTFAILAQRRKGKTYTASVIAEEMVAAKIPFIALDPTGAWWGLRAAANGRDEGLPVTIIGGAHGDVPLERTAGALIADLVVDEPGWYVLDLSRFDSKAAERQFATDFAERFYRRKAKAPDPVHLFVDEADLFAPQKPPKGDQRMLGAFEALVRRGGIRGIGVTLITQRPAVVNKNVLEQADVVIVLRVVGPNDQAAIKRYVEAHGSVEERGELMDSLASLKLGEAWVWEPGADPPLFERVQIRERETFNSSATPKAGKPRHEPRKMAEVDLGALSEKIAATVERAKADDPKELRKQLAEAKREVKAKDKQLADRPTEPVEVEKVVEVPVISDNGVVAELRMAIDAIRGAGEGLAVIAERLGGQLDKASKATAQVAAKTSPPPRQGSHRPSRRRVVPPERTEEARVGGGEDAELDKPAEAFLRTLVAHHPMSMTRSQVVTLSGYSLKSSSVGAGFTQLRAHGLIEESAGQFGPSEAGFDLLGEAPSEPLSPDEMIAMWRAKLVKPALPFFEALIEAHPHSLDREELVDRAGYSPTSSSVGQALTILRRNGLLSEDNEGLRASDDLFIGVEA